MDFLSDVLKHTQHFSLKKLLHERIPYTQKARLYSRVYASDLAKRGVQEFCPREYALGIQHNVKRTEDYINTALAMTFRYGKFYEDVLRQTLQDEAIGTWECKICGRRQFYKHMPSMCKHCAYAQFVYKGVYLRNPIYDYRCGIDLVVDLSPYNHPMRFVEIKTINDKKFQTLYKPETDHVLQVMLYLQTLTNIQKKQKGKGAKSLFLEKIDNKYAYIIYCIKGFGVKDSNLRTYGTKDWFTPFKEFVIEYDETILEKHKEKSLELLRFKKEKILPQRICQTIDDKRANKCLLKDICFNTTT